MNVGIKFDGGPIWACGLEFVDESFDQRGATREIEDAAVPVETRRGNGVPLKTACPSRQNR